MRIDRRWCGALAVSVLASACASAAPLARQECYNPDQQLARVLQPLEALKAGGCGVGIPPGNSAECERLKREIERLTVVCAGHVPTLMAGALIAYDDRQSTKAQQLLDQIFSQPSSAPDAAVLRARIAVDDGNLPFARHLLEQQMRLAPAHPGLHETYAAVLYLIGQMTQAAEQLNTAAALGAPPWRIAYHLGLIDEDAGRLADAVTRFSAAVTANPAFAPAHEHLRALRARLTR